MLNAQLVNKKLALIDQYLKELQLFTKLTLQQFLGDYRVYRTTERNLQLIVDTAVDINNYLILENHLPPPDDYYQSFVKLGDLKILPAAFASRVAKSTGLRNRLVHAYEDIDLARIFRDLKSDLSDYRKYNFYLLKYLDEKKK